MPSRPRAQSRRLADNARVAVMQWRMAPGAESGWRAHVLDCVVVYLTPAKHIVETRDGIHAADIAEGQSGFKPRGLETNIINAGPHEAVWVEIELK